MTPRPTSSTLFPYTTLFRSPIADDRPAEVLRRRSLQLRRDVLGGDRTDAVTPSAGRSINTRFLEEARRVDRKSTRLNSSHRCISYAVFCLKKKNKITDDASS